MNKSVYGLKSASSSYHKHLAGVLHNMGYRHEDSDLWMKDCRTHCEYIATWVYDLLIMSKGDKAVILELKKTYNLKGVGAPDYYLGGDFRGNMVNSVLVLSTYAKTYIKRVTAKIKSLVEWTLQNYELPEDPDHQPKLDELDFLDDKGVSKYRMMVGSLNWLVVLGRMTCVTQL